VPLDDPQTRLEWLILEGAQAGLSWSIVLTKGKNYRRAFGGFNPEKSRGTTRGRLRAAKLRETLRSRRCTHGAQPTLRAGELNRRKAKAAQSPSRTNARPEDRETGETLKTGKRQSRFSL
jgi:hypothetical protein